MGWKCIICGAPQSLGTVFCARCVRLQPPPDPRNYLRTPEQKTPRNDHVSVSNLARRLNEPPTSNTRYFFAGSLWGLVQGSIIGGLFADNPTLTFDLRGSVIIFVIYAGLLSFAFRLLWSSPAHE